MRVQPIQATVHQIEAPGLDPIRIVLQDCGPTQGRIIIECFGQAWGSYWGAMGMPLRDFLRNADTHYIVSALRCAVPKRMQKQEMKYLERIVDAIKEALNAGLL